MDSTKLDQIGCGAVAENLLLQLIWEIDESRRHEGFVWESFILEDGIARIVVEIYCKFDNDYSNLSRNTTTAGVA
jgi:hypothetical protein